MATQASLDQIQNLYIAFYGRPADLAGQTYWADELDAANGDLTAIIDAFASSEEYDSQYGSLTNEELVNALYQQILGRDAEQAGLDYYVGELEAGNITEGGIALAILNGATGDDAATMANRKEVADAFTAAVEAGNKEYGDDQLAAAKALLAGVDSTTDTSTVDVQGTVNGFPEVEEPVDPGTPGEEFMLTASTDVLTGTENNDEFNAYMSQNSTAGGVSNTLSSADRIDGGAGNDTLYAELVPEFFGSTGDNQIDVQPRISNVETIELEARDLGGNFDAEGSQNVSFDAKYVTDIDSIGSKFSDGDLIIENLTTLTSDGDARNTDEITITMDHTDNFNSDGNASDLTVYFDEDYLLTGQSSEAQAFFFLLDEDADLEGNPDRLDRINVDGIRFSLDGGETIIDLDDPQAQEAGTHAGFVAALQDELAALIADGTLPSGTTLTLDPTITDSTYLDNGEESLPIPAIVLTIGDGTTVTPVGFSQVEDAIGEYDIYGRFNAESETTADPLAVNIDLHKVGREGEGGNLTVGGKELDSDGGRDDEGRGINVFHVDVLGADNKPSNLGLLQTTNDDLEEVYISTADEYVDGDSHASLTIRDGFGQDSLSLVNANEFLGDLALGTDIAIADLETLVATGGGDVEFYGDIDAENTYSYTTGAGDDTVDVTVDGDAVDDVDTSLTIMTGSGEDDIEVTLVEGVSQETMYLLDNLDINSGAGADNVEVIGIGNFDINSGAASDFVYINSIDDIANTAGAAKGSWTVGNDSGAQTFVARVLYKAELTVTFAGFESTVEVETTAADNFIADQTTINEAIIEAIESNPELARLLETTLDDGSQALTIDALVEGLNDLEILLNQPEVIETAPAAAGQVVLASSDVTALGNGLVITGAAADSDAVDTAAEVVAEMGTDTATEGNLDATGNVAGDYLALAAGGSANETAVVNNSTINLAAGDNDLVVLNSNATTADGFTGSSNTIVIDQTFGKVSVVNFFDDGAELGVPTVGEHALDFTAYLNDQTSTSGSTLSAVDIAITSDGDASAEANEVSVLDYDETVANSITFNNLTAANLIAALNGDAGATVVGGLADGDLDAAALPGTLLGTEQSHIVMVENLQNLGEYKVFYLTSTAAGDFETDGELLGTVDFGNSIETGAGVAEINLTGSAAHDAAIAAFLA